MNEFDIIIRPHITEKSTDAAANGKYTFVVDLNATKIDIKKAIEKIFEVKVLAVNTMRYDGKKRSRRQASGLGRRIYGEMEKGDRYDRHGSKAGRVYGQRRKENEKV